MKSYLVTKEFWLPALERAVRAFAVAFVAALIVPNADAALGVDVRHVGWLDAASLAAGAAVLSLLLSVASGKLGPSGSPSLVPDPNAAPLVDEPEPTPFGREKLSQADVAMLRNPPRSGGPVHD